MTVYSLVCDAEHAFNVTFSSGMTNVTGFDVFDVPFLKVRRDSVSKPAHL